MTANALYYPYIQVPENPWFTRVLLYWDKVGAIVPYDYIEDPDHLGSYMVSLVRENLVTQLSPGMHLWRVENFSQAFIDYLDAKYGNEEKPCQSNWATVHKEKLGGATIHMEKLHDLGELLCNRGLAVRDENDEYSPWFKMEPRVASDFMAYLAGVLGQMPGEDAFSPITNQEDNLSPFLGQVDNKADNNKLKIRQLILSEILPAPSSSLEATQLLDFKSRYHEELKRFRRQVEDRVSALSVIDDEELQQMRMNDITAGFKESIDEIAARMREQKKWPKIDFGTICTVVGSGMAGWKAYIDQDWQFGAVGAGLSMAPAVYNAFRGTEINFEDKPLAYAALAHRQF